MTQEKDILIKFSHPLHITKALLEKGKWQSDDGDETITMIHKFSKKEKKMALALVEEAQRQKEERKRKEMEEMRERLELTKKMSYEIARACEKIIQNASPDGKNVDMDVFLTAMCSCFIEWGLRHFSDKEFFIQTLEGLPAKTREVYGIKKGET